MPSLPKLSGTNKLPGPDRELRKCIAEVIKKCGKSRAQIADGMSELLRPVNITQHMLNDFVALSKNGSRFPAAWVPSFCEVTGSDRLQRMLLSEELRSCLELGEKAAVLVQRHAKSENRA